MRDAYAAIMTQVEQFAAGLSGQGVHGLAVDAVARAQQLTAEAGAAWAEASTALERQNVVREAYVSAPEAGSKAFVTDAAGSSPPASADNPPRKRKGGTDPLKVADRMVLGSGDRFIGSGLAKDDEGNLVLAAAVDTPQGRQIHIGVPIYDEDRKNWRGAHALAQEAVVDDDGEVYDVDTGSDVTIILDAADAARLPEVVEEVIARATDADREYRQAAKESDRLYEERAKLEAERFASRADAEKRMDLDSRVHHHERYQKSRRQTLDECADRLGPQDRAAYDTLQEAIDAAGRDIWEPDKEQQAAAVCALTVDEFREMKALVNIPWRQRTRPQQDRLDQLEHGGTPPLLEQQQAIVCGLTVDELRELKALENSRTRRYRPYEQARLDELNTSPAGATAASPARTSAMRGHYRAILAAHHRDKTEYANTLDAVAALEANAGQLSDADAARLAQVTTDLDAVDQRIEDLAGAVSASAEIPGRNGGALVLEAIQRDEHGGVDYKVDRKPADADDDWNSGGSRDPYSTKAGGLRKVARLVADLAGQ